MPIDQCAPVADWLLGPYIYIRRQPVVEKITRTLNPTQWAEVPTIASSAAALGVARMFLSDQPEERMIVLYIDTTMKLLGARLLGMGDVNGVTYNPLALVRGAADCNATGMILAHNHPGGTCRPSRADIELTEKAARLGEAISVVLQDHLIVPSAGDRAYYSFDEDGHEALGPFTPVETVFRNQRAAYNAPRGTRQ
jgi:DNA repair protein RadC